jgi:hypothetical protein
MLHIDKLGNVGGHFGTRPRSVDEFSKVLHVLGVELSDGVVGRVLYV